MALVFVIVGKLDEAQQVDAQQGEDDNPKGEEGFAVEEVPAVGEVGHREELEREGQFKETERPLHGIEPAAALGRTLQKRGEERKEGERQGKGDGEAQHTDGRGQHTAARGAHFDQEESDDGTRTREADQRQRESHQEDGEQACRLLSLAIHGCTPRGGQRNLETAKETGGKNYQHQEEEDVEYGVRG